MGFYGFMGYLPYPDSGKAQKHGFSWFMGYPRYGLKGSQLYFQIDRPRVKNYIKRTLSGLLADLKIS